MFLHCILYGEVGYSKIFRLSIFGLPNWTVLVGSFAGCVRCPIKITFLRSVPYIGRSIRSFLPNRSTYHCCAKDLAKTSYLCVGENNIQGSVCVQVLSPRNNVSLYRYSCDVTMSFCVARALMTSMSIFCVFGGTLFTIYECPNMCFNTV